MSGSGRDPARGTVKRPRILTLGGGPAGVGAAYYLLRRDRGMATVLEQRDAVGGNAGSFRSRGLYLDYGSHRLHHACDPRILNDIQGLLNGDLRHRERHGRIRLRGKWIHFPLKPVDLLLRLDRGFALQAARDMALRRLPRTRSSEETFASVLLAGLGPTICRSFYFPYARKLWGREPEELSPIQARKRVSAGSFAKLVRRVLGSRGSHFYYPRRGYGQISQAYADAAVELGAELLLGWRVVRLHRPQRSGGPWAAEAKREDGESRIMEADFVWSTIPVTLVARMMDPPPPPAVLDAASAIEYRAMLLVYLELDIDQFTPVDAHYFPEGEVSITRLSEPKNYSGASEPRGRTTLCAELPCSRDDDVWNMSDGDLGDLVTRDLERADLALPRPPTGVKVKRLPQAYPIYTNGYERPFDTLDRWAQSLPNFLTYGRQGLFAHDNTHHALYMAYAAVDCLEDGRFNLERWARYRDVFRTHVVED